MSIKAQKRLLWAALASVLGLVGWGAAHAQVYSKFGPANGVLKGDVSTYQTTQAIASDITSLWTGSTCNSTTYLRGDGQCQTPPGTGGGTVNSVSLTAPAVFTVGGSPVTTSGTLAITFAGGQTANQVLASPNGSSGVVGLRALAAADLPAVPLATGVTGVLGAANGGTGEAGTITGPLKANGTSAASAAVAADIYGLWSGTCSSSTFLRGDGACAATNAGTVTSVALTVPSGFTVGGSPVTSSGTLAITGTLNVSAGGTGVGTLTGPIKGNGTSALSAAASADIYGLWSGTCSASTFLRGDGSCQIPGGTTSGANPTGLIGLTAVNGSAGTFTRSDSTHALDQSITPTMTGPWTYTNIVQGNGNAALTNAFIAGAPDLGTGRAAFENAETITLKANYGFLDNANVNFNDTGTIGHASYNANPTFTGTQSWDHHHDYQAVMHLQSSGTVTEATSFWAQPQMTLGTATTLALFRGLDPIKSGGTIGTLYGMYIAGLTGGSTNWAIYTDGTTPVNFGGTVNANTGVVAAGTRPTVSSAVSQVSLGATAGGTPQQWFIDSGAGSDSKVWDCFAGASDFDCRTITDNLATAHTWLDVSRTGVTVSQVQLGNVADSTTINLAGGATVGSPTGGNKGNGTLNATGLFVNGTAVGGASLSANNTWTGIQTFQNDNGASGTAILSNTVAGHQSNLAFLTDTSTQVMDLLAESATAGSGCATGAPTGQAGCIYMQGSFPFSIATNNVERVRVLGTGQVNVNAPTSGQALNVTGLNNNRTVLITGGSATSQSFGLEIDAGTNATDQPLLILNKAGSTTFMAINGAGAVTLPALASSSAATTGTVCWTSGGNLTVDTTVACLASTRKVKQNIASLDVGLGEVMKLSPVSYELKPEFDTFHSGPQVGLVAEDVAAVDPRLVSMGEDGPRGVRYMQLTAVLVKSIQQQQIEIEALAAAALLLASWNVYLTVRGRHRG